jgi:hypothetical protein
MPKGGDENDDASTATPPRPSGVYVFWSPHYQMSAASKKWLKKYRTEVAASSSSLLSTVVAVRHDIGNTPARIVLTPPAVSSGLGEESDASVRAHHHYRKCP